MAEENMPPESDTKEKANTTQEQAGPQAEHAQDSGPRHSRSERTARNQKGPEAAEDGKDPFSLLDKSLKAVDWSWANKDGADREIGKLTFVNAQNAWVHAALEDPKRAGEIWRDKTHKPPSADMEKMLQTAKSNGPSQAGVGEMDSLSDKIADLGKRRELSDLKGRHATMRGSLGQWNVMRGDAQQRAMEAKRRRNTELMTVEPNKDDTGFHLIKSLLKGFATHRESTQKKIEAAKARQVGRAIGQINTALGKMSNQMQTFETDLNIPRDERETVGVVGRSKAAVANNKAYKVGVVTARAGMTTARVAGKVVGKVAEAVGDISKHVAAQAAVHSGIGPDQRNAAYQARMAAYRQFESARGAGIAPGI